MTNIMNAMLSDMFARSIPSRKERKKQIENRLRKEHPEWPECKYGSEAGRRMRELDKKKVKS